MKNALFLFLLKQSQIITLDAPNRELHTKRTFSALSSRQRKTSGTHQLALIRPNADETHTNF